MPTIQYPTRIIPPKQYPEHVVRDFVKYTPAIVFFLVKFSLHLIKDLSNKVTVTRCQLNSMKDWYLVEVSLKSNLELKFVTILITSLNLRPTF